jgi:hypothetical protein
MEVHSIRGWSMRLSIVVMDLRAPVMPKKACLKAASHLDAPHLVCSLQGRNFEMM